MDTLGILDSLIATGSNLSRQLDRLGDWLQEKKRAKLKRMRTEINSLPVSRHEITTLTVDGIKRDYMVITMMRPGTIAEAIRHTIGSKVRIPMPEYVTATSYDHAEGMESDVLGNLIKSGYSVSVTQTKIILKRIKRPRGQAMLLQIFFRSAIVFPTHDFLIPIGISMHPYLCPRGIAPMQPVMTHSLDGKTLSPTLAHSLYGPGTQIVLRKPD